MANVEHENTFIHDLPYERTEWAQCFEEYKSFTQNQLQKYILKSENERKKWIKSYYKSDYESVKCCQHIFKHTFYDPEKKRYETPKILLHNKTSNLTKWADQHCQLQKISSQVLKAFLNKQKVELQEVKDFYEQRKAEIAISLKAHRKEHANEVIECPHCKAKVSRTGISKHKKSIKCLSSNVQNIQEPTTEAFVR